MNRFGSLVVVAQSGRERGDGRPANSAYPVTGRIPLSCDHLYLAGSGRTLCGLKIDETWERFVAEADRLSERGCGECRALHEAIPRPAGPA